ncbi:MAG: hypothetical protein WA477_06235 [Candidatus Sulfotelmatobacter sp.]
MGRKIERIIPAVVVIMCATIFPLARASAQAVSLQEQLAAQYKIVKMGSDTSGYSVIDKGTLLEIKKGGILGVPYGDNNVPASKYENGSVHGPSGLALMGRKSLMGKFGKEQTTHLFGAGDKVYPMKIDVNVGKDTVTLGIVACDTCNKTDPPTYNKANVVFQFAKGSLASASAGGVEDTIGQLLAISDDSQQQDQGGGQQQGAQGDQRGAQGGQDQGGQAAAPAEQAEPANIEVGMTPAQVEAALGKPDKKVTLPTKQTYYYKDMKVIFKDGKVVDVQ